MTPVEWMVDETTKVRLNREGGQDEIQLWQGSDNLVVFDADSIESAIRALICAVEAAGWDVPDLSREGYERKD